jgi:hypothetical protein
MFPPYPSRPTLTVAESTPKPSIPEGITYWHNIFGPGLCAWPLQVYTARAISELGMEFVFEQKLTTLHFIELQNLWTFILSHSSPFVPFIHMLNSSVPFELYLKIS